MARIRTVKPELFLDEELGVLSGDHAMLFVGLWTQADREGRLEDRPVRLKAALFPYRAVDVEALLADLARIEKIIRYAIDGERYIAIPGFKQHQRCHPKEPESRIPPPLDSVEAGEKHGEPGKNTAGREKPGCIPSSPVGREGKGREGKEISGEPDPQPPSPALAFFAWSQETRSEQFPGAFPENPPAGYGEWFDRAIAEVGDVERLRRAFRAFLADSWARNLKPPGAMQGFIGGKQAWRKYVPPNAPEPPKREWVPVTPKKAANG